MSQVILYDLPSRPPCKSWSLNPWKTRMLLNFKGIDYKTEWIEYPDLVSTLKSFGLPPNDPNAPGITMDYSSPSIRLADGKYMMDSWPIAHEIEKRYPTPPLHLDEPIVVEVRDMIIDIVNPLSPNLHPKVPRNLLNKVSQDYFEMTRETRFGMPLTQYESEKGGEKSWDAAREPMQKAADLLKKNGGPFFLGETVSYADLIFVSMLHFMKRLELETFERFLAFDPAFSKVYDASAEWLKKDD